jgi:hypothetical protein
MDSASNQQHLRSFQGQVEIMQLVETLQNEVKVLREANTKSNGSESFPGQVEMMRQVKSLQNELKALRQVNTKLQYVESLRMHHYD